MNLLRPGLVPILAPGIALAASYLAYGHLDPKIPVHWGMDGHIDTYAPKEWGVYLNPAAMALVYLFFLFVSRTNRGRTGQLKEIGVFGPLRNAAMLLFAYAHPLSLGIGLHWVSANANFLIGAASLAVLFAGGHLQRRRTEKLFPLLRRLGIAPSDPALRYIGRCIAVAGACGMAGTLTGVLQLVWPLVPFLPGLFLSRSRFPISGGPAS